MSQPAKPDNQLPSRSPPPKPWPELGLYSLLDCVGPRDTMVAIYGALQGSNALYTKVDALHGDISPNKIGVTLIPKPKGEGQSSSEGKAGGEKIKGVLIDYDLRIPRSDLPPGEKPRTGL